MDNIHYTYDEKFEENILILAQRDCGKTTFTQNIANNKFFGKIKDVQ